MAQNFRASIAPAALNHAAVVRLVWIFRDRDDCMLLRLPLLAEAVRRRHKVMVLTPDLTPDDLASLAAAGIDHGGVALSQSRLNPFGALAVRRRIAQTLHAWRASAVVVEDAEHLEQAVRAAAQVGISATYPILPAMERGPTPADARKSLQSSWRSSLALTAGVFVATPNDVRLVGQALGQAAPVCDVMPPVALDLGAVRERPLPVLGDGLTVLGAAIGDQGETSAYMQALETLGGRCRFRAIDETSGIRPVAERRARSQSVDWITVLPDARAGIVAAVEASHAVVIDTPSAMQTLLLATALAVGRPLIVADVACYRDLVDAGVNGWVVDAGDAGALAGAMGVMLRRPDLLAGMARASRRKAERKIDQSTVLATLFDRVGLIDLRFRVA